MPILLNYTFLGICPFHLKFKNDLQLLIAVIYLSLAVFMPTFSLKIPFSPYQKISLAKGIPVLNLIKEPTFDFLIFSSKYYFPIL